MDRTLLSQYIRTFIIDNYMFGRDEEFADDSSFLDLGVIDSTGVLELVAFIEDSYGFRVESHELTTDNLDSISKVTTYVMSKLSTDMNTPASARAAVGQGHKE